MKYYAFYLPQYHPTPENDEWWGQNFTEWYNVTKTKPLFSGHYQPHLPIDVGFYDLRLDSIREMQAKMARDYGVDGFVYYHYWFHGKKLLEKPLEMLLKNKKIDKKFAVCWANENWTRAWDGLDREMLIQQDYSDEDNEKHFQVLLNLFEDERYIKVNGRPLFIIYRPLKIKNYKKFVSNFRAYIVSRHSCDPFILGVRDSTTGVREQKDMYEHLDGIIDFQPNSADFPVAGLSKASIYEYLKKIIPNGLYQYLKLRFKAKKIIGYRSLVKNKIRDYCRLDYKMYPCVFPSWDNSARRNTPTIIQNNDAQLFHKWLKAANIYAEKTNGIVFINAWNEWAEGCHLEPDIKNGYNFLRVIKNAKSEVK